MQASKLFAATSTGVAPVVVRARVMRLLHAHFAADSSESAGDGVDVALLER